MWPPRWGSGGFSSRFSGLNDGILNCLGPNAIYNLFLLQSTSQSPLSRPLLGSPCNISAIHFQLGGKINFRNWGRRRRSKFKEQPQPHHHHGPESPSPKGIGDNHEMGAGDWALTMSRPRDTTRRPHPRKNQKLSQVGLYYTAAVLSLNFWRPRPLPSISLDFHNPFYSASPDSALCGQLGTLINNFRGRPRRGIINIFESFSGNAGCHSKVGAGRFNAGECRL